MIFSNPPYFEDSLTALDERKSTARHTSEGLSYRDILEFAKERLAEQGRVCLVLPADQEMALCRYARMCGLYLFRILRIRTVPRMAPGRIVGSSRECVLNLQQKRCLRYKMKDSILKSICPSCMISIFLPDYFLGSGLSPLLCRLRICCLRNFSSATYNLATLSAGSALLYLSAIPFSYSLRFF